ncbi:unnamed protein product [Xylocopa violacea]
MSGKERGLVRLILRNFIKSFIPKINRTKLIGEDFYGTKYYETQNENNSKRPSRYFEPVNVDAFDKEMPAEWEAWLRYRRNDPPTLEEIQKDYKLQMLKKQKAAQINAKNTKEISENMLPPTKQSYESFPVYEEYKDCELKYPKKQ